MHASAYRSARQFFDVYVSKLSSGTVVDIGSRLVADGQRTLRNLCPSRLSYLGIDLEPGINVDVVLDDPYVLPLEDASAEVVLCSSVFEHSDYFWELFAEILRVLKPGGLLYVNAPSNGYVHRHPVDCWRFFPDSGMALSHWGARQGHDVALLESFIADQDLSENNEEIWNDFVAVFIKGAGEADRYPQRMIDTRTDFANARRPGQEELVCANRFSGRTSDEVMRWARRSSPGARKVALYQIAYSEATWKSVPEGMLPLDNRANERPDWAEYWPIRRFLQSEALDENCFYGFLSPRFGEKMFFPPEALVEFVASVADDVDVAAFSPFFDLRAVFLNVFEHGEFSHPGLMDLSRQVMAEVLPGINLRGLVNTSMTAIFCNYFAATPRFWREWLALGEQIFIMAETVDHPCAAGLNRGYAHGASPMPAKVFLIERLASLLLAVRPDFKIEKFAKSTLTTLFGELPYALFSSLDTLKIQGSNGNPMLLTAYDHIQREILASEAARIARDDFLAGNHRLGLRHVPSQGYEHWGRATEAASPEPEKPGVGWLLRRIVG